MRYGTGLALCLMLSVLSGCYGATVVADCWFSFIRTSVDDQLTEDTADQIIQHNLLVAALCDQEP